MHSSPDSHIIIRNKNFVPEYDSEKADDHIRWIRCTEFAKDPEYFKYTQPTTLTTGRSRSPNIIHHRYPLNPR